MDLDQGTFSAKFQELEPQYDRLSRCLKTCQQGGPEAIRSQLRTIAEECQKNDRLLRQCAASGRSPAVAALSLAQLSYCNQVENILTQELPGYLHSEGSTPAQDQAEAAAVFAEYAIDSAVQAARYALWAALSALDAQNNCDEIRRKQYE